tara:strand:- start:586 stop:807 length:222 start_codon:yes stop_codon:yes gene_type:complete
MEVRMTKLYATDYVLVDDNNKPTQALWLIYGDEEEVKKDAEVTGHKYIPMTKLSKHWQDKYIKYLEATKGVRK